MKKGLFISGFILTLIALALCLFGNYIIIDGTAIEENSLESLGLIVIIPLAIAVYLVQIVLNVVNIIILFVSSRSFNIIIKILSIILLILNVIAIGVSIYVFFKYTGVSISDFLPNRG